MASEKDRRGIASELIVEGLLVSLGIETYPGTGNTRADFIRVDANGNTHRAQVKTTSFHNINGIERAMISTSHGYKRSDLTAGGAKAYTADEIDEFWCVGTHIWYFPLHVVEGLKTVTLGGVSRQYACKKYDPEAAIIARGTPENPMKDRLLNAVDHPKLADLGIIDPTHKVLDTCR